MTDEPKGLLERLKERGVTRRQFIQFCGVMAATLALPIHSLEKIATALAAAPRLPVVWLEFQDCTGDTESFLRSCSRSDPLQTGVTDPGIIDLVLDVLSVDYHETIMAPSGANAEKSRADALANYRGQYICVVEGSIPTAANGIYCTIGGRSAVSIADEMCRGAAAVIAMGSCAWDGGLAGAAPNPTGATGVSGAVPGLANLVNIPGCPANTVNLVATIVYYLTFQKLPALDSSKRPSFAFNREIHERCERHDAYENDHYVQAWGDSGHRQGWCLIRMGCRGPDTRSNCPTVRWNNSTNWPIGAGHPCIGCTNSHFWDTMTPFYHARGD